MKKNILIQKQMGKVLLSQIKSLLLISNKLLNSDLSLVNTKNIGKG